MAGAHRAARRGAPRRDAVSSSIPSPASGRAGWGLSFARRSLANPTRPRYRSATLPEAGEGCSRIGSPHRGPAHAEPQDRRPAPLGYADGNRALRRDGEGRHQAALALRRGQKSPRLVQGRGGSGRLHRHRRRGRQHVRAAPRADRGPAAAVHGEPPRHPADRRQVRRHARRAQCAGGDAHAARVRTTRPTRRSRSSTGPTRKARASRRRCWRPASSPAYSRRTIARARADRDGKTFGDELERIGYRGAGEGRRPRASARCSNFTSSRGRSSRTRTR